MREAILEKLVEKLKEFNKYLLKYSDTSIRIERFESEIVELEKEAEDAKHPF